MAKRRGFFAEIRHHAKVAESKRRREENAAHRAREAAARQSEQARRTVERALAQAAKTSTAARREAELEAKRFHEAAMQADAEARNGEIEDIYDQIDSILRDTLEVDDFVDLETFRKVATHPPFPKPELLSPIPPPSPLTARKEPEYNKPETPAGLVDRLFGKRKHAQRLADAEAAFAEDHARWLEEVAELPTAQERQRVQFEEQEHRRQATLLEAKASYEAECRQREAAAQEENEDLDNLIQGLAYGVEDAIQEYVSIVLGNSAYPECFPVKHEFTFDSTTQELDLIVLVPSPDTVPAVKDYKYIRAKDEVVPTPLAHKDQRARYANAIAQVALRTLHEVFESDRAGRIQTITLTVASEAISPATGLNARIPLLAVGSDRAAFISLELSRVEPLSTLQYLGATVSKSPLGLVPIDTSKGVRSR